MPLDYLLVSSVMTETFPSNLDPSYKKDLDLWDCFRMGRTCIIAKFHRTDLVIYSHSRERKPCLTADLLWLLVYVIHSAEIELAEI